MKKGKAQRTTNTAYKLSARKQGCIYFLIGEKKMKKKVLMGIVLLAMVAASAAFAHQATLDKLSFTGAEMSNDFIAMPANDRISGAVVIPATYNGKKVFAVMNFMDCRSITSVTILASVTDIYARAFRNCTSLTSVTFQRTATNNIYASGADASFPGDLAAKYKAGGAGTYTRSTGGTVWTKQGAAVRLHPCRPRRARGSIFWKFIILPKQLLTLLIVIQTR
jgi:hypothetical protein